MNTEQAERIVDIIRDWIRSEAYRAAGSAVHQQRAKDDRDYEQELLAALLWEASQDDPLP